MKAIILVGGYGTRLRPFTFSLPKPLVPFANKPIVVHQIEALVRIGVREIVLAVNVQPQAMMEFLQQCEKKYNIKIHCSQEEEPMGTAGPLALARSILAAGNEPFFMFNSDVICTFPLEEMLRFHRAHGKEGSILVTPVDDPSKYGVVVSAENGEIQSFVEKPTKFISNRINAGIYLFNSSILDRIELRPTSIEREIFPKMAGEKQLYSMLLPGYWMDIGQPRDFLKGMVYHLDFMRSTEAKDFDHSQHADCTFRGNVLIDPSARIGRGCVLGPDVVIGRNVVIGDGVRLERTTLMENVRVKNHALVKSSIIGWESVIGQWSRVDHSYLGKDVVVGDEVFLNGATVCPHKGIKEDVLQPTILL